MPAKRLLPAVEQLVACTAEGMTYAQIAARYGVTEKAVAASMLRAGRASARPRVPVEDRFWAKVDKTAPGGCWLWTAAGDSHGYGQFKAGPGSPVKAYRWAWEYLRGPIPDGATLDHLCRVKLCVNPAHLAVATQRANILRSSAADGCGIRADPAPYDDRRVEVQLRTQVMHAWAITVERLSGRIGANLKGDGRHAVQQLLAAISQAMALEETGMDVDASLLSEMEELRRAAAPYLGGGG